MRHLKNMHVFVGQVRKNLDISKRKGKKGILEEDEED